MRSPVVFLLLATSTPSDAFICNPTAHLSVLSSSSTAKSCENQSDNERPSRTLSKREFLSSSISSGAVAASLIFGVATPRPANAAYGTSSNIELPNYIEFLIEKNSSTNPDKILYKGADADAQIKRLTDAAIRLNDIPTIAREKKWSQVQGILTGPLGTLVQTMNTLSKDSTDAKKAAAKVKQDIILISQEAGRKSADGCVKACELASKDLEAFIQVVF